MQFLPRIYIVPQRIFAPLVTNPSVLIFHQPNPKCLVSFTKTHQTFSSVALHCTRVDVTLPNDATVPFCCLEVKEFR